MDIEGAKVLKRRLGAKAPDEARPLPEDVPVDAPPLYRWLGVGPEHAKPATPDADDELPAQSASLLRRLGLNER